jgi:hypothetical protein
MREVRVPRRRFGVGVCRYVSFGKNGSNRKNTLSPAPCPLPPDPCPLTPDPRPLTPAPCPLPYVLQRRLASSRKILFGERRGSSPPDSAVRQRENGARLPVRRSVISGRSAKGSRVPTSGKGLALDPVRLTASQCLPYNVPQAGVPRRPPATASFWVIECRCLSLEKSKNRWGKRGTVSIQSGLLANGASRPPFAVVVCRAL